MKRITTLRGLMWAVRHRKAVTVPSQICFAGRIPAAFMQNLQGHILHRLMQHGMFVYESNRRLLDAAIRRKAVR